MKTQYWSSLTIAALVAFAAHAPAQLIVNGGFETPIAPGGWFFATTSLPGWYVSSDVELVNSGYWQSHSGNQSLDLSGNNSGPGSYIEQAFATTAGQAYELSFYYGNNADVTNAVGNVSLFGAGTLLNQDLSHSGSTHAAMDYTLFQHVFVADAASTVLRFTHVNSPVPLSRGLALDDVAVTLVPEPSILSLCGLGALMAVRRQRTTKR